MDTIFELPGLKALHQDTLGDPGICVAVLDGPVDLAHPCFEGADLTRGQTLVQDAAGAGPMSAHGTHVASLIFGQPGSPAPGLAPRCRGLVLPVFGDAQEGRLPQLDLARAIEQAVRMGANVINVSGGERSPNGQADGALERALWLCEQSDVLVVAAAGNDGCECLHVPASLPSVLAVGALAKDGEPHASSNWGAAYRSNGVLAPGEAIVGAAPGGGTSRRTGSSFATPLVSGVVAALMSLQRRAGDQVNPREIADAILRTATPCAPADDPECRRYLAGVLNLPQVHADIRKRKGGMPAVADLDAAQTPSHTTEPAATPALVGAGGGGVEAGAHASGADVPASAATHAAPAQPAVPTVVNPTPERRAPALISTSAPAVPAVSAAEVIPCCEPGSTLSEAGKCGCQGVRAANAENGRPSYVYALGKVGFDFGTEARRDTFRQSMPSTPRDIDGVRHLIAPNPYDPVQLSEYLESRPSENTKLIWTLNLDLTPIYAIEAEAAYPDEVYEVLRDALKRQVLPDSDEGYVARVSIPGVLTGETVRLFSGQVVPKVRAQARGLFEWNEKKLLDDVVSRVTQENKQADANRVAQITKIFLDKIYYECRNLGASSPDRALNFAATNAYMFADGIANGVTSGKIIPGAENDLYTLDRIEVSKSPFCRMDSDCWDVRITFFDPENDRKAKAVQQYTIDVSDEMPVSLAPAHIFLTT